MRAPLRPQSRVRPDSQSLVAYRLVGRVCRSYGHSSGVAVFLALSHLPNVVLDFHQVTKIISYRSPFLPALPSTLQLLLLNICIVYHAVVVPWMIHARIGPK